MKSRTKPNPRSVPAGIPFPPARRSPRFKQGRRQGRRNARGRMRGIAVPHPAPASNQADPAPREDLSLAFLLDAEFDHEDDDVALSATRRMHLALLHEEELWGTE